MCVCAPHKILTATKLVVGAESQAIYCVHLKVGERRAE